MSHPTPAEILARVEEQAPPMSLDNAIEHLRGEQARALECANEFDHMGMAGMVALWQSVAAAYDVVLDHLRAALQDTQHIEILAGCDYVEVARNQCKSAVRLWRDPDVPFRVMLDAALSSTPGGPQ